MKIKILAIDDERSFDDADLICRTYSEGEKAILEGGWDALYLDHDLADMSVPEKTGYSILLLLEDPDNAHLRPSIVVLVTANSSAYPKMEMALFSMGYEKAGPKTYSL